MVGALLYQKNNMKIVCSKTGSSGNFSIITDGNSYLAIDAGLKIDKCQQISKYQLHKINGIIITHNHSDHISHLKDFIKMGKVVYAPEDVWHKIGNLGAYKRYCKSLSSLRTKGIEIGSFIIKPFKVKHLNSDLTECNNYGYLIYSKVTKEKMLWITDCAYINNTFPPVDYICIECNYVDIENYTEEELNYISNISVEKRRFDSHLSLSRCIKFLKKQDLSKIKFIKLLHLSESQGNIKQTILDKMQDEFKGVDFFL